jgi:peroxiredoxin
MSGSGEPLPDFALPDLTGSIWRPDDLRGAPAVLFCFATW